MSVSPSKGGIGARIRGTGPDAEERLVKTDTDGNLVVSGTVVADLADIENVTVRQATPTNLKTSVSGADASGSAPSQYPVLVAGSDGTNVRTLSTTTTGLLKVEIADVTEGPPLLTEGVADPGDDTVALSVKPLLVGVNDPSNLLRSLRGAADGTLRVDPTGTTTQPVRLLGALIPVDYDHVTLGYTGADLTSVVYRTGGAGGTTVATLTLGYSGGDLVTIGRT